MEYRPNVVRGENLIRIRDIRSDTDPKSSLALTVAGGDVGISITTPKKGTVAIDLAPLQGGGANPDVTAKFRAFVVELANLIESSEE
jgi:hypothetical protein